MAYKIWKVRCRKGHYWFEHNTESGPCPVCGCQPIDFDPVDDHFKDVLVRDEQMDD